MKYNNKRLAFRGNGGKFRKATLADVGAGVCPTCNHITVRHYNGDPRTEFPFPNLWVYRCFNCNPRTDAEKAMQAEVDAKTPRKTTMADLINRMVSRVAEIDELEGRR